MLVFLLFKNGISAIAAADCIAPDWPMKNPLPQRCGLSLKSSDYSIGAVAQW